MHVSYSIGAYLLITVAAFLAGIMNAIAGGGSIITFPVLVFTGVPSIIANASSTVAMCPAGLAAAWAYRNDLDRVRDVSMTVALTVSLTGGILGALLLLVTPERAFDQVIPWLLLTATLLFASGPTLAPLLRAHVAINPGQLMVAQFIMSVYCGYYGGGVGVVMMAVWAAFGHNDVHALNAAKTLLIGLANFVAVVLFIIAGKIWWPQAMVMLVAGVTGGFLGAYVSRQMQPQTIRLAVIAIGATVTVVFFLRAYA